MRRRRTNLYQVLGVPRDAPPDEVKRAYRELAKRLHPDRHADADDARAAEERLKLVNAAWHDYLASQRAGDERRERPKDPPPKPRAEDDAPEGARYEAPPWRRRRAERPTRDRYRAERARATRDREERERQAREQADEVRRRRDAEIDERVERDRARAAGILGLAAAAGLVLCVIFVIMLILYGFASAFE